MIFFSLRVSSHGRRGRGRRVATKWVSGYFAKYEIGRNIRGISRNFVVPEHYGTKSRIAMWRVGGNAANNGLQKCKVPVVSVTF
jgi:hypothetical protein